jgi:hypothetical protein
MIVFSRTDPRTVSSWGRLAGASRATVGVWCRAAHVPTKQSLDLGRLLRAIRLTGGVVDELQGVMDVVDPRTVARMLVRAGIHGPGGVTMVHGARLLTVQRLVTNVSALEALAKRLGCEEQRPGTGQMQSFG